MTLRVCLLATEILGWGVAGGYGFAVRSLGRELVRRGVEVHALVPRPRGAEGAAPTLDGICVHAYPRLDLAACRRALRDIDAHIHHSQEPNLGTWVAQRTLPSRIHCVTSRDPRLWHDWWVEFRHPTYSRAQVLRTACYYENPLTRASVRAARAVYVPARCLAERVQRKYNLADLPAFMPTPIRFPAAVAKADEPTVCYVGRLDRRKRPERLFELAARHPEVRFLVAGRSQDAVFAAELGRLHAPLANVEILGFIDQFESAALSQLLSRSWILVNTSAREGLPNSYIEAAAHGCAILSQVDPDGFASRFGMVAGDDDFSAPLSRLLTGDLWRSRGAAGRQYVLETNEAAAATERHLQAYERLCARRAA